MVDFESFHASVGFYALIILIAQLCGLQKRRSNRNSFWSSLVKLKISLILFTAKFSPFVPFSALR